MKKFRSIKEEKTMMNQAIRGIAASIALTLSVSPCAASLVMADESVSDSSSKSIWQIRPVGTSVFTPDTGLVTKGDKTVYYDDSGIITTGWVTAEGKTYYFSAKGYAVKGVQAIDGKTYYFDDDGVQQTGWQKDGDQKYYFTSSGEAATGLQEIDGSTYYFSSDGVLQTGLQEVEGTTYYFNDDGQAAENTDVTVDNTVYTVDDSGKVTSEQTAVQSTQTSTSSAASSSAASSSSTSSTSSASASTASSSASTASTSTAAAAQTVSTPADANNCGTAGNLYIPSLGIDVALYYGSSQAIVGAADSAAYFSMGGKTVIADHYYQNNFVAIASASGATAYIYQNGSTRTLSCIGVYEGKNTGSDLVISDFTGLSSYSAFTLGGSLIMYTCVPDVPDSVYITIWA